MAEIKDLLSAAAGKNVSDFTDAFNELMRAKVAAVLDDRRAEVLGTVFAKEEVGPEDEEDDLEIEWDDIEDEDIEAALEELEDDDLDEAVATLIADGDLSEEFDSIEEMCKAVRKAGKRKMMEDIDTLDELSLKTLSNYITKANKQANRNQGTENQAKREAGAVLARQKWMEKHPDWADYAAKKKAGK